MVIPAISVRALRAPPPVPLIFGRMSETNSYGFRVDLEPAADIQATCEPSSRSAQPWASA